MTTQSITQKQYQVLIDAFAWFNAKLFDNQLPDCMILMQRKGKRNLGYFHPARFTNRKAKSKKERKYIDELSLNPDNLGAMTDTQIMQTVAHEMCHLWQHHFGKASRNGYHNKEWGRKMKEIGLYPSNTGKPGGKETGQQMMDYVIDAGKFQKVSKKFMQCVEWTSFALPSSSKSTNNSKTKYTCAECGQNAWAKPGSNIKCGDCDESMEEQ